MPVQSQKPIVCDYVSGPRCLIRMPWAASQVVSNKSGKFCKLATNLLDIADSGDTELIGWVVTGARTTAAGDFVTVDVSPWSLYWIPADATVATTIIGDTCDLIVASDIQKADIGESNEDVIQIVAIDTVNDMVLVHMNPLKLCATGVA